MYLFKRSLEENDIYSAQGKVSKQNKTIQYFYIFVYSILNNCFQVYTIYILN